MHKLNLSNLPAFEGFLLKITLSFVRAFVAAFAAGAGGILAVPNLTAAKAALLALSVAALTAGVRAVQHFLVDA